MNIWLLVISAVIVVLTCILVFRLHAFLTLLLAGLLVSALMGDEAVQRYTELQVNAKKMTPEAAATLNSEPAIVSAPSRLAKEFGETAGKIGILIALASIIGQCLMESGAAKVIVDRILRLTGPKHAPEAMAASSFVLGIPVFFDTVFYLMVPLARSLRERLGKNYVLYILSILAGGSIAHSLIPPTPGPLTVAGELGIDLSTMLFTGLLVGGCSSIASLGIARIINRFVEIPLRQLDDSPSILADSLNTGMPTEQAPSLTRSLAPILVPVVLIAVGTFTKTMLQSNVNGGVISDLILLASNKNVAIAIGAAFALSLRRYCKESNRESLIARSLASAGNIILITAAGGAFGAMLRQAGIGEAVGSLASGVPGHLLLVVAFVLTASIRTLQGSATVAMITAAGILQGFTHDALPYHPVYLAMAIGAGSKPVSWMTDSAFWVMTRMSGMTESEGLRVISPMSIGLGLSALFFTILFANIYPFPAF
ncbi:MAG: GntP family permease [Rubripirellula sp.]|nr:GntP family permease [Rubripirellula sp.]